MRPVHVVVWLPLAPAAIISFFTSSFLLIVYIIVASHIIKISIHRNDVLE